MSALESKIENDVSRYAMSQGVLTLKLNVSGRRGWPDRIYLCRGKVMFIEFKREGETPRKLQQWIHGQLRSQGFTVYVIDTVNEGMAAINVFLQECAK